MWLFFTLATTLLWGAAELFYKKGSHEECKYDHLRVCVMVGAVMGIHAVITLEGTTITIDGMESSMFMGINREHTEGNPIYDKAARPVVPKVQSAKITLG